MFPCKKLPKTDPSNYLCVGSLFRAAEGAKARVPGTRQRVLEQLNSDQNDCAYTVPTVAEKRL